MNWYVTVLNKYAVFTGRARRKEFWMFTLVNSIAGFSLGVLDGILGTMYGDFGILNTVYGLSVFLPVTAVFVRRMHDINFSGWWVCSAPGFLDRPSP